MRAGDFHEGGGGVIVKIIQERICYFLFCGTTIFFTKRLKMNVDELINKLQNPLNKLLINENVLNVKATELSNELLETLKIIENCTSCKDNKIDGNDLDKIEKCLTELKKEQRW